MGLIKILLTFSFIGWALWYVWTMRKVYKTHLRYLFEPDVNLMAQFPVGARYDAVHLKKKFWKIVLSGIFMVPIRAVFVLWMLVTFNVWAWCMMKLFGGKNLFFSKIY